MTLFDFTPRSDQRPARDNEPLFDYYNISGRSSVAEIRAILEAWFQRVPESAKTELRARFRSHTDSQHRSAFFEIYLHELLCRMGFAATLHPNVPGNLGTHPDFVVSQGDMPCCYLEATLALPSVHETAENARIAQVYDTLNRMVSLSFFLAIRLRGAPATPPPGARLRRDLMQWLSGLDPDVLRQIFETVGLDGLPSYEWSHDGWDLSFLPIAKPPSLRGQQGIRPIGMKMSEMRIVNSRTAIKTAVCNKATKYGDLALPFVVAVNVIDRFRFARDVDIMNALFGEENITDTQYSDGTIDRRPGRNRNGAWFGPQGAQNTRVSAALVSLNMDVWNMVEQFPKMIHNPWAARPLPHDLWPLLQLIPILTENRLEPKARLTASEVLGLPTPWPPID
ncbi:MAG: hypothetical protein R3B83_16995 [Nitrospirales bacterium]|nr:hypothetical protein [Nitrospirales bacterium]